jgi:hypothetical protein
MTFTVQETKMCYTFNSLAYAVYTKLHVDDYEHFSCSLKNNSVFVRPTQCGPKVLGQIFKKIEDTCGKHINFLNSI